MEMPFQSSLFQSNLDAAMAEILASVPKEINGALVKMHLTTKRGKLRVRAQTSMGKVNRYVVGLLVPLLTKGPAGINEFVTSATDGRATDLDGFWDFVLARGMRLTFRTLGKAWENDDGEYREIIAKILKGFRMKEPAAADPVDFPVDFDFSNLKVPPRPHPEGEEPPTMVAGIPIDVILAYAEHQDMALISELQVLALLKAVAEHPLVNDAVRETIDTQLAELGIQNA